MKKFPVISENGNEYLVKIGRVRYYYSVGVYRKGRYFNHYLSSKLYFINRNDFVEMAKETVRAYESEKLASEQQCALAELNRKKFEEWDGDCRE